MKPVILAPNGRPARLEVQPKAYYEASRSQNPNRSRIPMSLVNAKRDITAFDRYVIAAKSRYLYENFPLYRALVDRFVTYVVGPGIFPVPSSEQEAWNVAVMKAWKRWARRPDLQTQISWGMSQRISLTRSVVDGDSFTYNTYGASGRARTQLIEGINIQGGSDPTFQDGYELDTVGRVKTWWYRPDPLEKGSLAIPIDPNTIVQHYFPHRAQQYRGVCLLVAGINTAHDLDDTLALEKAAVKDGSGHTDIIKTAEGQISAEEALREGTTITAERIDDFITHYKTLFGPEARVMNPGDSYEPYESKRPSPAWQGFVDLLCQLVCLSLNIPPSILLPVKIGGADTRRDTFAAQRVFELYQYELANQYQRVYEHWLQTEIDNGFMPSPPADWDEAEWYFPRTITVDNGRDIKADIELVKMRLMTRREFFAIYSQTYWKSEMRQAATEVAQKYSDAKEFSVPVWELELLTPNGNLTNQDPQANQNQGP